jgi:hypothetical protein
MGSCKVLPIWWGVQSDHCIHVPCTSVYVCFGRVLANVCSYLMGMSQCVLLLCLAVAMVTVCRKHMHARVGMLLKHCCNA